MTKDQSQDVSKSNWLVSFGLLMLTLAFAAIIYIAFVLSNDSRFNPADWDFKGQYFLYSFVFSVLLVVLVNYFVVSRDIDFESKIESAFDTNEYRNAEKKWLDCILSHYANVATVGLLLMSLIFILKPYVHKVQFLLTTLPLGLFTSLIFALYSLFFIRLAKGLAKYSIWIYFAIGFLVLILDMQVIELFIKSVPQG
ncbi:hypothetical protein [Spongorhabdus nitratireducens]